MAEASRMVQRRDHSGRERRLDVTVIVPSHNRHAYLERTVGYYRDLEAPVVIYDSSAEPYQGALAGSVAYRHVPGLRFVEKMALAIGEAGTSFVACCPDDDFILHSSLCQGVEFLAAHRDFAAYVGRYLAFHDRDTELFGIYDHEHELSSEHTAARRRAKSFFGNYFILLWALFDRNVLAEAYKTLNMCDLSNDNFIEIVIGAVTCARGKLKVSDKLWGVREITREVHWGMRQKPLTAIFTDPVLRNDCRMLRDLLDQVTETGYTRAVLTSYFFFCLKGQLRGTLACRALAKAKRMVLRRGLVPAVARYAEQRDELTLIQRHLEGYYTGPRG